MHSLCNSIEALRFKPQLLQKQSHRTTLPHPPLTLPFKPKTLSNLIWSVKATASDYEIDMVKTNHGVYTAKPKKVVILWDLDNKPPRGPPYQAALSLKHVAQRFGEVVDMSAYANRHAFIHLPQWVVEERRDRRRMDVLERKGVATPSEPYVCSVCGRKCKTNLDLKKHFRQLHERERQKKLNRLRSLKGKKRQRFKERHIDGNEKYNEAARSLVTPKVGYGLAAELRRAGVYVKTVADKPQAADWALKKQMQHSMSRGIDWLLLVSDDSDFSEMLRRAKEANLGTVVVGDFDRALGRHADIWVPWMRVENGHISESDLQLRSETSREVQERSDGRFSVSEFDGSVSGERSWENALDELVGGVEPSGMGISAFSDREEEDDDDEDSDYEDEDSDDDDDDWFRLRLDQRSDGENEAGMYSDGDQEGGDFQLDKVVSRRE